jgi:hypothetical protein
MPLRQLRSRFLIAMGLGSCAPAEPPTTASPVPPEHPVPAPASDAGAEAAWALEIDSTPDAGPSDASASANEVDGAVELADAARPDAHVTKTVKTWYASYRLAPGTEKWCKFGNTMCQEAGSVQGAVDDKQKLGCPRAVEVPCPCTPAGCNQMTPCIAPLQGAVTGRERAKVKNACCYDMPRQCVPPWVGRPLRDAAGATLVFGTEARADWRSAFDDSELSRADAATRRERARVWTQVASLEHASVASFAKVALQLLALGAPPELLRATHAAGRDEIVHAQLAFAIASASLGSDLGPIPLPAESLRLDRVDLESFAVATFRDGCVDETLGVIVAREQLQSETSPTIRRALERIIADEERHAELAWRTLAWTVREGGPNLRSRLFAELEQQKIQPGNETRSRVLSELIEPCLRALLVESPPMLKPCLLALVAWCTLGCSPPCETSDTDPVRFEGGTTSAGVYQTSAWEGPYLHFPGGRRYQLVHGLGTTPPLVASYVSIAKQPFKDNNASENAGNQGVIELVNDEIIQIRNDTCAEFYLRVVAYAPGAAPPDAGGISDSGSD